MGCATGLAPSVEVEECTELLAAAQELGVEVVGVAFHVGSGAKDARILGDAMGVLLREPPFTLAIKVFGVRSRRTTASKAAALAALTEHASSSSGNASADECAVMDKAAEGQDAAEEGQLCRSTVFGPTCDGSDTILRDVWLPRLDLDDWLMGAYTQAAGSSFNGFVTSDIGIVRIFSSAFPEPGPSLAD
ncbi:unnamed protein product [Closterium sp. NIES-53]